MNPAARAATDPSSEIHSLLSDARKTLRKVRIPVGTPQYAEMMRMVHKRIAALLKVDVALVRSVDEATS